MGAILGVSALHFLTMIQQVVLNQVGFTFGYSQFHGNSELSM